jgi:hypothetical protein
MPSSTPSTSSVVFTSGEHARHRLEFGGVRFSVDLGHRVAHQDHPIVVFEPAAHGRRDADASGDAGNDAGRHPHIPENSIERCIREAAKTLLGDQMLACLRL